MPLFDDHKKQPTKKEADELDIARPPIKNKFEQYPSGTVIEQTAPNVRRVDFMSTRRKSELSSNAHSYNGRSSLCIQYNIA